jgi:hypothetical protein
MPKQAISVTLTADNVTWLKGRARAGGLRGVSELVDQLVTNARAKAPGGVPTSVVGTIDIDAADPLLLGADDVLRDVVYTSVARPASVKDMRTRYGSPGPTRRR